MRRCFPLVAALWLAVGCDHGESDAGLPDSGRVDGGTVDARADSGVDAGRPDAGFTPWDGVTVPAVEWELPACVETYGVLERGDEIPSFEPPYIDARAGITAIAWRYGQWVKLRGVDTTAGEDWQVDSRDGARSLVLQALTVSSVDLVTMLTIAPLSSEPWRPRIRAVRSGSVDVVDLDSDMELSGTRIWMAPRVDGLRFVSMLGGTDAGGAFHRGFAELGLDPSFAAMGPPRWIADGDPSNDELAVVTDGTARLLLSHVRDGYAQIEAVPFDDATIGTPARFEAAPERLSNGYYLFGLRAALDGDTVVVLYNFEPLDFPDLPAVAELSFRTGELLAPPRYLGGGGCLFPGEIVSHPGGGVDIVRQATGVCGNQDYRLNTPHPLEIHLGLRAPIELDASPSLRIGAGAYAHSFRIARDGDRLVVVWAETGPSTLPDRMTGMRHTVEGLFYAVLRCDGT